MTDFYAELYAYHGVTQDPRAVPREGRGPFFRRVASESLCLLSMYVLLDPCTHLPAQIAGPAGSPALCDVLVKVK